MYSRTLIFFLFMNCRFALWVLAVGSSLQWCLKEEFTQEDQVYSVDYSADGTMYAVGLKNKKTIIYQASDQMEVYSYTTDKEPFSLEFNYLSDKLIVGYDQKYTIVDLTVDPITKTDTSVGFKINDIDCHSSQNLVVFCGDDKKFRVSDGTTTTTSSDVGSAILSCQFVPGSTDVLIGCDDGRTYLYSSPYTSSSSSTDFGDKVLDIAFRDGSSTVYLVAEEADSASLSSPSTVIGTDGKTYTCSYAASNDFFMFAGESGKTYIYNATDQNNTSVQTFDNTNGKKLWSSDFSDDGNYLLVGCEDEKLYIYTRNCINCLYGYFLNYTSLQCTFCGSAISGCGVCNNETVCISCIQGFYLDTVNDNCIPCDGAMTGCGSCLDSDTCLFCMSGYYLDSDSCVPCGSAMPGCLLCTDSSTCLQCHSDFFLQGNDCSPCSDVDHCLRCNSTTYCIECQIGYFVDTNDLCTACDEGCLVCNSTGFCSDCTLGYYSNAGVCSRCSTGCLACNNTGWCFDCESSMILDTGTGTCSNCPISCATCDSSGLCLTCYPGYYEDTGACTLCEGGCSACNSSSYCFSCLEGYSLNSNACTPCIDDFSHCISCTDTTCIQCLVGFYPDAGSCQSCGVMHGCEICDSAINCYHCSPGHYLAGVDLANNSCQSCPQGCLTCQNSTVCTNCAPQYYLNVDACDLCQSPCLTCSDASTCLSCPIGFYFSAPSCLDCDSWEQNCLSCLDVPVDGLVCVACALGFYVESNLCEQCLPHCTTCFSSTQCLSCELGYYLQADFSCSGCAPECAECDADGNCQSCLVGYYLSVNSCLPCTTEGCLTCNADLTCASCVYGFYINGTSHCQLCSQFIPNCLHCNDSDCFECSYGYTLSSDNSSCIECSDQPGCLHCQNQLQCLVCQTGYYLDTDDCHPCSKGCNNCQDDLTCLQCGLGYYLDNSTCLLCQSAITGCDACLSDGSSCIDCSIGFYLDGTTCTLCQESIDACSQCNASDSCLSCKGGFYLSSNTCQECSVIPGCLLCDDETTCVTCKGGYYEDSGNCLFCDTNMVGCQQCSDFDTCLNCLNGYYLFNQECLLCADAMEGCIFCEDDSICLQCEGGYFLNGSSKCEACGVEGCEICSESDQSICITCNGQYYMSSPGVCTLCRDNIPNCVSCSEGSSCDKCDAGYYYDGVDCLLCAQAMDGCSICSSSSICLDCKSLYFVNNASECELCSSPLEGCAFCADASSCISCMSGYYLNGSSLCQPCTNISGCLMCKDQTECIYCDTSYYLDSGACESCSIIDGCYACASDTTCTSCLGGYSLDSSNLCQEIDIEAASNEVSDLVLKTFYQNEKTLKHILYAIDMSFTKTDLDWDAELSLSIVGSDGQVIDLTIRSVEWGDNEYTLIIYTNNPLNIDESKLRMPFARLLQSASLQLNSQTSLSLTENGKNKILPNYAHSGALSVTYDLNNSEFYASYVEYNKSFLMEIIGVIFVVIIFVKYSIKSLLTVPLSLNMGNIIPHILAFKVGALLLYPTFMEYIQFSSGFMAADFPWLNFTFGNALSDSRDESPVPYSVFYINMNLASTYLLACFVILIFVLVTFLIGKKCEKQMKMWAYFRFLYNFFIFGAVFAGCASLQGSIMNPVVELSVNGVFYILGIILYFSAFCQILYRLYTNVTFYFWRVRVFLKATLLSLSHFSPIYLVSTAVLADLILIAIEYKICKYPPRFPRWWIFSNVVVNLSLLLLIYLPIIQLSLLIITLLLVLALVSEAVMHYKETKTENQDLSYKQSKIIEGEGSEKERRLDTSEKDIPEGGDNFATIYVGEEDDYKPFEPIKKTRERNFKKVREELKKNLKQGSDKKINKNDDSQSFTFTMDNLSQD